MHRRTRVFITLAAVIAACLAGVSATSASPSTRAHATTCSDAIVIGVHGVGEDATESNHYMGGLLGNHFYPRVQGIFLNKNQTVDATGVDYPKTTVVDLLFLLKHLISPGQSTVDIAQRIDNQVIAAQKTLANKVDQAVKDCPDRDIVVAGYSEGAWVADLFVTNYPNSANKIEALMLFGDPQYRPCSLPKPETCITTVGVTRAKGTGIARDENLRKLVSLGADVPKYLPVPAPASTDDGTNAIWDNTRSYCLTYKTKDILGHDTRTWDPICAWGIDPVKGLTQFLVHIQDYYNHEDANGQSVLDQAVSFLDTHILGPDSPSPAAPLAPQRMANLG